MVVDYTKKEVLEYYYDELKYSIKLVGVMCDCHPSTIRKWLGRHDIQIRSSQESKAIELSTKKKVKSAPERLNYSVGDFALSFERLCRTIRLGIWSILKKSGLKDAWECTDILVGDLTAFPLQSILRALINQTRVLAPEEESIVNSLFKRVVSVTEARNNILHAAWYIDYKSRPDLLNDVFTKYRPGYAKFGAKPTPTKISITEVETSAKECRDLMDFFDCLNGCLYRAKPFTEFLQLSENKIKFLDPAKKRVW